MSGMKLKCPECGGLNVHIHYGKGGPNGWGCPDCKAEGEVKEHSPDHASNPQGRGR